MKKYNCSYCTKEVMKHQSQVRNENKVYCNTICKNEHQKELMSGVNNPNYKSGRTLDTLCSCGNEKDFRAQQCSICSKKGYSIDKSVSEEYYNKILIGINAHINQVTSFQMLAELMQVSRQLVTKLSKSNNLDISHFTPCTHRPLPFEQYLINGTIRRNNTIKKILIENKLKEYKCDDCGNGDSWNGKPLTIELHHINGNSGDNRIENLQFICPNCHSQTDTNKGKNSKRRTKDAK